MTSGDDGLTPSPEPRAAATDHAHEAHEAKVAEASRLAADLDAAWEAIQEKARHDGSEGRPAVADTVRRVVAPLLEPTRLLDGVRGAGRRTRRTVSSMRAAVRGFGGPKAASRRAVGLLLRDGLPRVLAEFGIPAPPAQREEPVERVSPRWYSEDDPEVSVVVLNWNQAVMTLSCLQSLWQHTSGHSYEIVVVDNGSREDDLAHLASLPGPGRVLRVGVNRYFGEGNNLGVEAAKGRYVVVMNNDAMVTAGWLEPLMHRILETPECGVVGPKFLYPDGLLQEAGGLFDDEGRSVQRGKYQDPTLPEFNSSRPVDYVSAACCLLRRDDFLRVLGFDLLYEPAYYEDADLCMKLSRLGLSAWYVPESVIVHHESVTTSAAYVGLNLITLAGLNKAKFMGRWGEYLRTGRHAGGQPTFLPVECAAARGRRTMAVYCPSELSIAGGERTLFTLMSEALRAGCDVSLVTPFPYSRVRVTALADTFGVDVSGLCLTTLEEATSMAPFDEWVAWGTELLPPAPALGRRSTYLCQFPFPTSLERWRAQDLWLHGYDRVLVGSGFTAAAYRGRLAAARLDPIPILTVTPPVDVSRTPPRADRSGIVSTGRFLAGEHGKRQDLLIDAFSRLVEAGITDGQTLHLVGSSSAAPQDREFLGRCLKAAEGLDVVFRVNASREELRGLYERASVYWHGKGLGADPMEQPWRCEPFGMAPVEAMSFGAIPVVVGNGGPAVTVRDGVDGLHYRSVDQLVARTTMLLTTRAADLEPMRESARRRSQQFTREAFATEVAALFDF